MNRSIPGCLQESEQMPGEDDVRAVENTGEQKSFCLQSTCEWKMQSTHLSISTALQTAIQAIPSRVATQNYFNRLSLVSQPLEMKAWQLTSDPKRRKPRLHSPQLMNAALLRHRSTWNSQYELYNLLLLL